jgi:hypothetical protein
MNATGCVTSTEVDNDAFPGKESSSRADEAKATTVTCNSDDHESISLKGKPGNEKGNVDKGSVQVISGPIVKAGINKVDRSSNPEGKSGMNKASRPGNPVGNARINASRRAGKRDRKKRNNLDENASVKEAETKSMNMVQQERAVEANRWSTSKQDETKDPLFTTLEVDVLLVPKF